jgi:hypothetical protein
MIAMRQRNPCEAVMRGVWSAIVTRKRGNVEGEGD